MKYIRMSKYRKIWKIKNIFHTYLGGKNCCKQVGKEILKKEFKDE